MGSMARVGNLNYLMDLIPKIISTLQTMANFIKHFLSNCLELRILLPGNKQKGCFAMLQIFPQWPKCKQKQNDTAW